MEALAALIFAVLALAGILCVLFLAVVQPIWGIVDVAVSKEHSGGTKAVVIILTLLLLGPIMTFFYGCFGTRSNALRRATVISFGLLVFVGISAIGIAVAVPAAKSRWGWGGAASKATVTVGNQATSAASSRLHADQVSPFTALHLVPKDGSGWSVCIAEFTGYGPKPDSTIPLVLPSIYPVSHLAMDTKGPVYYASTTHEVGRIIPATGRFVEFESDPAIGKPSWPSGVAYDSKKGLLLITARSQGYSYNPSTGEWKIVPGLKDDNLVGLAYAPEDQILYSLRTKPGGELADKLVKFSSDGALLGETALSQPIAMGRYPFPMAQLSQSGDQLIVLVSPQERGGSPSQAAMYSVNPASGLCRLIDKEATVEGARVSLER